MGLIRKVASTMMLGGVSSHTRRKPPGKAERARAKAERAREEAAQAQAVRAEAEAKVAEEQAVALARALHQDEAHRQADLREVAEEEAEAVPEWATRPRTAPRRAAPTLTAWVIMMRRTTWNTPATSPGRLWADGECHRPPGRCRCFPRWPGIGRGRAHPPAMSDGRPGPTRPSPTGCCGDGPGARVAVDGLEHVSAVGPCVVVSDHRSGRSRYP